MPLRPATHADSPSMLAWRNQPANREVSINRHVIEADEHEAWWARVKEDPTRSVLVFEHDGRPLGVVSFFDIDPDNRSAAWGFYLDHDTVTAEGIAMTAWLQVMKEAIAYAFDEPPAGLGLEVLEGEVLEGNDAVRMMNRRFRFTEGEPEVREADGRTITVYPIRLRREDRRRRRSDVEGSDVQGRDVEGEQQ